MATVMYLDEATPHVEWLGYAFTAGVPVDVTDEAHLEMIKANSFFALDDSDAATKPRRGRPPNPQPSSDTED